MRDWPWRRIAWAVLATLLIAATAVAVALLRGTPSPSSIRDAHAARPSQILAADGSVLARIGEDVQEPVALADVSPQVLQALLATEDQRFREHWGVDVRRCFGAAWNTLHGQTQGGSTITQQLARNLFPDEIGRERTLWRKAREMVTAMRIERLYSKDEILAAYLNTAPFLYNVSGIEMAARTYFGEKASALDTLQSATLVGMLKGAHYYDPARHPERALQRRNVVLKQMQKRGHLSEADYERLRAQPLALNFDRVDQDSGDAPHFVAHVRKQLADWADENGRDLYRDGLVVETALDPTLQQAAEQAVAAQTAVLQKIADQDWGAKGAPFARFWRERGPLLEETLRASEAYKKARAAGADEAAALRVVAADKELVEKLKADKTRIEAGFVALDPRNGAVKAWVGSRDFARDQYDHVALAKRQPGSTFKPFVYGAALQLGLSPQRLYVDMPVSVPLPDGTLWEPTDMGGATGLYMTLREGLAHSKNTITAQVAQEVGVHAVAGFARAAGVQSKLDEVPSLALGTSPVSLLEMAGAYATIASLGERRAPVTIVRIKDRHGEVLQEFAPQPEPALSRTTAERLLDMMRDVVISGTGSALRSKGLKGDFAGKTGTTQNNTDAWFIAMHPQLVAGAWVGFNDQRVRMRSDHWGQGARAALPIVGDFLRGAQKAKLLDAGLRFRVERVEPEPTVQPQLESEDPMDMAQLMAAAPTGAGVPPPVQTVERQGAPVSFVLVPEVSLR